MESYLDDLKKQIQCSLCNGTMTEPKLLQCFHAFCKNCIRRDTTQLDEEINIFQCPKCASETILQNINDVEDLQTSPIHSRTLDVLEFVENPKFCSVSSSHPLALWQCFDCSRSMCDECLRCHSEFTQNHHIVSLSDLKRKDIEKMLTRERSCKKHGSTIVEFHCQDCDMLICLLCLDEGHRDHKTKTLQELMANEKGSLLKTLEEIYKMDTDENEKKQQEEIAKFSKNDCENAREKVKEFIRTLIKALKQDEQNVLHKTQKSIKKATRNLRIITHATQAREYIKYFVENGTASEMLDARQGDSLQNLVYEPFEKTTPRTKFKPNRELRKQTENGLGMIRPIQKSDPKMSFLEVDSTDTKARAKAKLTVNLRTSNGDAADELLEDLTIKFTPEADVQVVGVLMTDDGEAIVDFITRVSGPSIVDVRVKGKSVSNCPLRIHVKPQEIKEVTGYSKLKEALNTGSKDFTGIAVDKTRRKIAVADWESHCVRVFDVQGDLLLTYGTPGSLRKGQLRHPCGLAFLNETDLVIADNHNHRVCIVNTATGNLVKTFGREGKGNGQFQNPCGVHVNGESNIIICDSSNNRVQVFTKDGHYLYQFGVRKPLNVVTHNERFYSVDCNQAVVNVLELKGNRSPAIVGTIGGKANTDVRLQAPWGAVIESEDNLLVCDYIARFIHMFTLDDRYVGRSSQLTHQPRYISVLDNGVVICTTMGGGCRLFKTNHN